MKKTVLTFGVLSGVRLGRHDDRERCCSSTRIGFDRGI